MSVSLNDNETFPLVRDLYQTWASDFTRNSPQFANNLAEMIVQVASHAVKHAPNQTFQAEFCCDFANTKKISEVWNLLNHEAQGLEPFFTWHKIFEDGEQTRYSIDQAYFCAYMHQVVSKAHVSLVDKFKILNNNSKSPFRFTATRIDMTIGVRVEKRIMPMSDQKVYTEDQKDKAQVLVTVFFVAALAIRVFVSTAF